MVKQSVFFRYRATLIPATYVLLAILVWLLLMREFRLDDSFITYRYARNLAQGYGLVYNPGENVLSTTAPLYAMLLAGLSFIIRDFHVLGGLIGTLCIGLGGWLISAILPRTMPTPIRLWAGVVYTLSSPLWLALGMETPLWLALVLGAVWLAQRDGWGWSGLLVGLAVLTRPDAALPGALLWFGAVSTAINRLHTRHSALRPAIDYTLSAAAPILLFALWAAATYGSPFPATLGAKSAQATLGITGLGVSVDAWGGLKLILRSLMDQSSLYIALGLLAVFGLAGSLSLPVVLIVAWGMLHLLAYIVMGVAPYRWYYAPLLPGAVLLAACGVDYILQRLRARRLPRAEYVVAALAIFPLIAQGMTFGRIAETFERGAPTEAMLPIVDWQAYRQTGDWLRNETPPDATIGVAEVGQVGFYAERWMTDYLGLLQPDAAAMLRRGDLYSWMVSYAPDYLVFQRFRGAALVLYNYVIQDDAWFTASYQAAAEFDDPRYASGPVTIFQRVTPERELSLQPADLSYDGLRLVGLATDGIAIPESGGTVRVRLDWQVTGTLPTDLHIAVKGLDMAGGNPGFDGDYITQNWTGTFSTWHGFVVPEGVEPGRYTLLVAVGPKGGPYDEQGAGWLEVAGS